MLIKNPKDSPSFLLEGVNSRFIILFIRQQENPSFSFVQIITNQELTFSEKRYIIILTKGQ